MKPKFELGERVRFKEHVFTDPNYTPYFDAYEGQEFIVTGYMPDEGVEFTIGDEYVLDGEPFKNDGFVYDHIGLQCVTGDVLVKGFVHDWDLEIVCHPQ